jgi:hypothetical protein
MGNSDFSVGLRVLLPEWASAYLDTPGGAATVAGISIVLIILVWFIGSKALATKMRIVKEQEKPRAVEMRELAVMVEHVESTAVGNICGVLLVITLFFSMFGYSVATTIFQQIEAGVSLMAGVLLFGLGVVLGRKRTYRIYRSEHRTD